jgi:formylglycine-generating enzyme required for sulfatase activity
MNRLALFLLFFIFTSINLSANGVRIERLNVLDRSNISFYISWQNSWNNEQTNNHDAVWIFIKVKENETWKHVTISEAYTTGLITAICNHSVTDRGLIIRRKDYGSGAIPPTEVHVRLKDEVSVKTTAIQVHGIEMVFVSQGSFWVGDGASNFTLGKDTLGKPYEIHSENELLGLKCKTKYFPADVIPASFPKGYAPFYMMKYEISQEQYTAFLNTLNYFQQKNRTQQAPESSIGTFAMTFDGTYQHRNGIVIIRSGNESTPAMYGMNANADNPFNLPDDGANRACNFLSWGDVLAYLDWSGLRPMTELEYEKACRGADNQPKMLEYAWGTSYVRDANTLLDDATERETVGESADDSTGIASHGYEGPWGPLRCGFSAKSVSNRLQSGAGYYGAMELSGNLWELCISVLPEGMKFDGEHGDGSLDFSGSADVQSWLLDGVGAGYRGGAWLSGILPQFRDLAVSDRFYAGQNPNIRRHTSGGRGVLSWR